MATSPQWSASGFCAIGPVLFLIFINDLEVGTTSTVLKFADDTKLFRSVVSQVDRSMLNNDLDTVCEWADRWQMKFNVSKCKVMHYGRKDTGIDPSYYMYGQPIEVGSVYRKGFRCCIF